jgi:hypothetical protein
MVLARAGVLLQAYGSSVTVNVADRVTPRVPDMVVVPIRRLCTRNVAVVVSAATTTLLGTVATSFLLLDRDTDVPVDGAGPVRTTVPVDVAPSATEVGFNVREASCDARIVRVALRVTPL